MFISGGGSKSGWNVIGASARNLAKTPSRSGRSHNSGLLRLMSAIVRSVVGIVTVMPASLRLERRQERRDAAVVLGEQRVRDLVDRGDRPRLLVVGLGDGTPAAQQLHLTAGDLQHLSRHTG